MGLRNPTKLNINRLGVKCLVLSRNNFGDEFAYQLSMALKADEYIKSICLKKNNIGSDGLKNLAEACTVHPSILSIDLRYNPCFAEKKAHQFKAIMRKSFFSNLAREVKFCEENKTRIKIDWIFPACLGLEKNPLDEHHRNDISINAKRKYFAELLAKISDNTNLPFSKVFKAFLGTKAQEFYDIKKIIEYIH